MEVGMNTLRLETTIAIGIYPIRNRRGCARMDNRTSLEGDDFDRLMQVQGWQRQDFDCEPAEGNRNVIGQTEENRVVSHQQKLSSDAFFFHFEDTTFRKLLRHILSRRQCSYADLLQICSNKVVLDQHVSYMLKNHIVVSDSNLWKVNSKYEHISNLGKTLEWYVAEWFSIRLKVPARYGVHIKGLAKGGDLDVVAFIAEKPVMVECKTSKPDTIEDEELHLFLQRIAYFKPLKALLLVDTESKIESLSDRLRKVYITSEIIGPFSSTGAKFDLSSVNISNTRKGIHLALSCVLDNSKSDCDKPLVDMSLLDMHKIAGLVPGLNRNDSQVLKLICEKALETCNPQIDHTRLVRQAERQEISQESFAEAIDILEKKGYINWRRPGIITILTDGFEEYAKVYINNYFSLKREIASFIVKNGSNTTFWGYMHAEYLNCYAMVIDHILDYFEQKELIQLAKFVTRSGDMSITNISPLLKRVVREGEEF